MNNSALRTMDILELLAQSGPLSVSEISRMLNIPKTSAFDILSALTARGFTKTDPLHRYSLGLSTYRVGMAYIGSTDLYEAGHHRLRLLSRELQQTVYLAVMFFILVRVQDSLTMFWGTFLPFGGLVG